MSHRRYRGAIITQLADAGSQPGLCQRRAQHSTSSYRDALIRHRRSISAITQEPIQGRPDGRGSALLLGKAVSDVADTTQQRLRQICGVRHSILLGKSNLSVFRISGGGERVKGAARASAHKGGDYYWDSAFGHAQR